VSTRRLKTHNDRKKKKRKNVKGIGKNENV
jgi:hypothetical protein